MPERQRIIPRMLTPDLLEFHAFCLTNTGTRLEKYAAAMAQVIRPGDTVLDLGAGFGILGVLACRAGARRVYAVEHSAACAMGRELVRATPMGDRITFFDGSSFDFRLDQRVDVVVADVHSTFGLQEGGLSSLADARERLLKPGGAMMPTHLQLFVAPAEAAESYNRRVAVWQNTVAGLDLSPVRAAAANRPYPARLTESQLLGPLLPLGPPSPLGQPGVRRIGGATTSIATRAGTMHGLCGCYTSTLAPGITLSNVPGDSGTTNFAHAFLPFEVPFEVAAGDRVEIQVDVFDGLESRWKVTVTSGSGQRRRAEQSTLFAGPLSSNDLKRDREDYCPRLTDRGRLELELLTRFDGATPAAALREWLDANAGATLASPRARALLLKDSIARSG